MNPLRLILCLLLALTAQLSLAQSWERTFLHPTGQAIGFAVLQTADLGYVMAGEVDLPTGAIRHYIWLVKTDQAGNELWSKIYDGGDVANQTARALYEAPNGDLFVVGSNANQASVFKTNALGDSLWTRDFGGAGRNSFQALAEDSLGNLILVGRFEAQLNSGQAQVWAMGMNLQGDSLWAQSYLTPSPNASAMGISVLASNEWLITGRVMGQGFSMKMDGASHSEVWSRLYQFGSEDQWLTGGVNAAGNHLLLGGRASGFAGYAPILLKTDLAGLPTDTLPLDSVMFGAVSSLTTTADSGMLLTGSRYQFWQHPADMGFVRKLNANLQLEWELVFADSLDKQGAAGLEAQDGSYLIVGSRQGGMWLKKIGASSTAIDAGLASQIKLYPNPASATLYLELPASLLSVRPSLSLYDATGRWLLTQELTQPITQLPVGQFPPGWYHYTIQSEGIRFNSGTLRLQ